MVGDGGDAVFGKGGEKHRGDVSLKENMVAGAAPRGDASAVIALEIGVDVLHHLDAVGILAIGEAVENMELIGFARFDGVEVADREQRESLFLAELFDDL